MAENRVAANDWEKSKGIQYSEIIFNDSSVFCSKYYEIS